MRGRSISGFEDGTKMRLFVHPGLAKSDDTKGKVTKACERQKVFLEAVIKDCSSSPLWLDAIPEGCTLLTLRELVLVVKSVKFPSTSFFIR